jgi:uncharacterized protein YjiS (DUF1127 family)
MSVIPLGGPAGPLPSQSQSSLSVGAWLAQAGAVLGSTMRAIVRLAVKAIAEHHTRRAVRDLQHLDDRLLRDMGLTRGTIEHAVRHGRELDMVSFAAEWALWGTKDASQTFKRPD